MIKSVPIRVDAAILRICEAVVRAHTGNWLLGEAGQFGLA